MRRTRLLLAFGWLLATAGAGHAEKRIAILIGNQSYSPAVGQLKNVYGDMALVGAALKSLNFKVAEVKDADYRGINTAINRHIEAARNEGEGAVSFIYYAGHGAANPDTKINYLIPVDIANADDELWAQSVNLNRVVEDLREQAPGATHYVVFDACRNELNLTSKGKRSLADRGFAPIAYTPGVLIAYATAPGKTASDSGVYARFLAVEIVKPGIEAVTMFRRVALSVNREIGQDPWMASSTLPEVYLAGNAVADAAAAIKLSEAERAWNVAKETKSVAVLKAFVARHGDTFYAEVAKARIGDLTQSRIAAPVSPSSLNIRPPPLVQAGGLLKEQDTKRVRALTERLGIPLPDYEIQVPAADVAADFRRFVGVWADEVGSGGGVGRTRLLIVTRIDKDGRSQGILADSGPKATTASQRPASSFRFSGSVSADQLRFNNPRKTEAFRFTLTSDSKLSFFWSENTGRVTTSKFSPVWTLVAAERAAKH